MKDIQGYEGLYACHPSGKIWAYPKWNWNGRFLKTWLIGHGYEMVMLYKNKKPSKFLVHRLVAMTFIPNFGNLNEVNHKNGKIRDNRVENLEWVTSKQNKRHAWSKKLYKHNKLTDKQIKEIREKYISGGIFQRELAVEYGTTQANISWIIRKKGWSHII